ncbi:protein-(glutamine-N5) methyltransferase, release factor-specific [Thermodesulfobium narugense DSM 14796]|uniref:peptide chain release factor N(5)-glutamine methyltransferase n=1 Tax=Thermodesulfobium narugense DSM 14796 TaxID=747365 RepID=M1E800_9BACT|nr:peptide chain release factor N(5)-glutamine methyltransferase [Thermodesulfobium narugense]AEE14853.1 protein-(glutamine-N5) methyltransferase, release factor-specific [Thermodesulfobium narugense DSM 14796]
MIRKFKKKKTVNLKQFARDISDQLKNKTDNPFLESKIILSHFLEIDIKDLYLFDNIEIDMDKINSIYEAIELRLKNKPLEYIIGYKPFRLLKLKVNEDVLIPRNETEEIIDIIKKFFPRAKTFLDIGTGSGAIALSLVREIENSFCVATDISERALMVAKENAKENNLENKVSFELADLFPLEKKMFDVIVSNPPYIDISNTKLSLISKEIYFEPKIALFAENKGLYFYEKILSKAKDFLLFDGGLVFEVGFNQAKEVVEIGEANNFSCFSLKDLYGVERFVVCRAKMIK